MSQVRWRVQVVRLGGFEDSALGFFLLAFDALGNGGTFEVTIYHRPGSLRIEVRDDGSPSAPVPRPFDSCSLDGRGLELVACLAHRWGQRCDEFGRCVYFELR